MNEALTMTAPRKGFLEGMSRRGRATVIRTFAIAVLVVLWELYAFFGGGSSFIASPSAVVNNMVNVIWPDPKIRRAIGLTLYEIVVAYGFSVSIGLAIGLLLGWTTYARKTLFPILILLHAVPQVVLLPLFVLFLGIGPSLKIVFGFSHGVFPIIVNVMAGMQTVNALHLRGARSMGATRFDLAWHVYFPHMVPAFFTGLRLSMTLTLLGVILAELYVSVGGLGYYTKLFAETFRPAPLFALIFTVAIMAIVLNEVIRLAERQFTKWKN